MWSNTGGKVKHNRFGRGNATWIGSDVVKMRMEISLYRFVQYVGGRYVFTFTQANKNTLECKCLFFLMIAA